MHVKRNVVLALALVAVLAAAAVIRPPRAGPALSLATSTADHVEGCPQCHPERSSRKRAKSKGARHGSRPRKSHKILPPPIDLNRATAGELARIPGVSDWLARRIVAYRALVGPFDTLDDLSDLDGMSASRLASLGRYVVVR